MEEKQSICHKCGKVLKEAGTDQNGKYKICKFCNTISGKIS